MKNWWSNERVCQHEAFLALFVFTIWETRNRAIFKNIWTSSEITVNVLLQKIMEHQTTPKQKPRRVLKPPNIDKNTPWAFFDGASQGEPPLGGVGAILFMNESTKTNITFAPG